MRNISYDWMHASVRLNEQKNILSHIFHTENNANKKNRIHNVLKCLLRFRIDMAEPSTVTIQCKPLNLLCYWKWLASTAILNNLWQKCYKIRDVLLYNTRNCSSRCGPFAFFKNVFLLMASGFTNTFSFCAVYNRLFIVI